MIDWRVRPLVLDIQKMLQTVLGSKVMLVRKKANAIPDWVVVNTKKGMCMSGWDRQMPSSLVRIFDKDGVPPPS